MELSRTKVLELVNVDNKMFGGSDDDEKFDSCVRFLGQIYPDGIPQKYYEKVADISECPHCLKVGAGGNFVRWHFDNCKLARITDSENIATKQ